MLIIGVCALLVLAGLAAIVAWGGATVTAPAANRPGSSDDRGFALPLVAARVLWWTNVILVSGVLTGILMSGAGGRLIMRLLAVTSAPETHGLLTEAGERIGTISLAGTVDFLMFGGVAVGFLTGVLYALLHRWLPGGRLGGLLFGLLLLVGIATTVEPLRPDNFDFALLDPPWLAVSSFSMLVLAQGMLVAAIAGWLSERMPLLGQSALQQDARVRRQAVLAYLPLLVVLVLLGVAVPFVAGAVIIAIAAGTAARRWLPYWEGLWRQRWVTVAGQLVILALAVAAVPGFIGSVAEILAI